MLYTIFKKQAIRARLEMAEINMFIGWIFHKFSNHIIYAYFVRSQALQADILLCCFLTSAPIRTQLSRLFAVNEANL